VTPHYWRIVYNNVKRPTPCAYRAYAQSFFGFAGDDTHVGIAAPLLAAGQGACSSPMVLPTVIILNGF
jgi:hypothetical protein